MEACFKSRESKQVHIKHFLHLWDKHVAVCSLLLRTVLFLRQIHVGKMTGFVLKVDWLVDRSSECHHLCLQQVNIMIPTTKNWASAMRVEPVMLKVGCLTSKLASLYVRFWKEPEHNIIKTFLWATTLVFKYAEHLFMSWLYTDLRRFQMMILVPVFPVDQELPMALISVRSSSSVLKGE